MLSFRPPFFPGLTPALLARAARTPRQSALSFCLALAATLLPAVLFFAGKLELPAAQLWVLVAAVVWFVATPLWMEHKATD